MVIDYSVTGEDKVALDLRNLGDRATDAEPALHQVADLFRSQIGDRFDAEGPGWSPLKDSTVASKGRQGLSSKILQATGAGRASLAETGGDNVEVVTGDTLIFGSSLGYMGFHQRGTSKMAQRKVIDFGSGDRAEHAKIIQRFIVEGDASPTYRIAIGV